MIKEQKYNPALRARLERKQAAMGFPRQIVFELTYRCNLACRYCYIPPQPQKPELNTAGVKEIFRQLADAGCLHITLSGGEPLLRPDIISLLDYARSLGLFSHVFTNATLITPDIAQRLKEARISSLEISLHSLKEERFDWFTQTPGSFAQLMRAIKLAQQQKIFLAFKITITKNNFDEIQDLYKFAENLGAVAECTGMVLPRTDGNQENLTLRLDPEQVILVQRSAAYHDSLRGNKAEPVSCNKPGKGSSVFHCGAARKELTVNPQGELKPCFEFPGSGYFILDGNLKEGQQALISYVDSFKPSAKYKCPDCRLRNFCLSCPALALAEAGDINACPDYHRRLAELMEQDARSRI